MIMRTAEILAASLILAGFVPSELLAAPRGGT